MAYLNQNACSYTRRDFVYAKIGDPVTVIADHGTVLIVEDKNLQRFPVLRCLVSDDPVMITDTLVQKNDTPVSNPAPFPAKTVPAKRKKSVPTNQSNLSNQSNLFFNQ